MRIRPMSCTRAVPWWFWLSLVACSSAGGPANPPPSDGTTPAGPGTEPASEPGQTTASSNGPVPPTGLGAPARPLTPMSGQAPTVVGLEPITMDECPGDLPAEVVARLQTDDVPESSTRWLYPYDETVFPRGLTAPILQWDRPADSAASIYVRLTSTYLDVRICAQLEEAMRFRIPQSAWDLAAAQSAGKTDPLRLEVVLDNGTQSERLASRSLVFALADLKGAVYYNTYGSLVAAEQGILGGVVMRVRPGAEQPPEVFLSENALGQCIGCHSVSADGSTLIAEVHEGGGAIEGPSRSFDLLSTGDQVEPTALREDLKRAGFAGIYPDGSVYVTTARTTYGPGPVGNPPNGVGNVTGTFGPEQSKLFDTMTGEEVSDSGLYAYAYMPTFSVDGTLLVFNAVDGDNPSDSGHSLAVMDYDPFSRRFSSLREIFQHESLYPSWPFFLPEVTITREEFTETLGRQVLFALVANNDLLTSAALPAPAPPSGDLYLADVESGTVTSLDRANGTSAGKVVLPYGEAEAHQNFVPTVSPVAAGGYFWVFFTSRRNYGNIKVAPNGFIDASLKKIWVAAIDIHAPPGTDASHPAFYLPNQELESGNIRAFAALEPCKEEGVSCETGVDCCCGYCVKAEPTDEAGVCACEVDRCSGEDEKCDVPEDCCDSRHSCLGGYCGWGLQ